MCKERAKKGGRERERKRKGEREVEKDREKEKGIERGRERDRKRVGEAVLMCPLKSGRSGTLDR